MNIRTDNDLVINSILPGRPALAAALYEAISNPEASGIVIAGVPCFAKTALLGVMALIAAHQDGFDPARPLPVILLERSSAAVDVLGDVFLLRPEDVNFTPILKYSNESNRPPVPTIAACDGSFTIATAMRLDVSDMADACYLVRKAVRAGALRLAA